MNFISSFQVFTLTALAIHVIGVSSGLAAGDPKQGKKAFLACVSCHSAEPGLHKTGPSLSNIWGNRAGSVESFNRYSEAIRNSGIVWNDETLDAWLRDPQSLIPDTLMKMRGLDNKTERRDIVAYLKQLASGNVTAQEGSVSRADPADLSNPPLQIQVTALELCQETYTITTASGETLKYWEFNLRLKTDASARGPPKGKPVLVGSGMRGDRASLVFASPAEISPFIKEKC